MSASLLRLLPAVVLATFIAACSTTPQTPDRDGPATSPPSDLERVPDAVPQVTPVRPGGANKPYEIGGQRYVPLLEDGAFRERGLASWYGRKFHGRLTASGEPYDMYAMTAAHPTWPLPSYARVRNPANGREVIVRVNDRGPFVKGRIIDLSYTAALKLRLLRGVAPVEIERLTNEQIASGRWRGQPAESTTVASDQRNPGPQASTATNPDVELTPVATTPAGYWLQLGAFRERSSAESLQQRVSRSMSSLAGMLTVLEDGPLLRVQAGPFATRNEALSMLVQLRESLQLSPVLVDRR